MAFPRIRIALESARSIFDGVEIIPVELGGKTVGYRAKYKDHEYEASSLSQLCTDLWKGNA